MEDSSYNKSAKLSDKQQGFKIKLKSSRHNVRLTPIDSEPPGIPNPNFQSTTDIKPVYEKLFIADAKSGLISFH